MQGLRLQTKTPMHTAVMAKATAAAVLCLDMNLLLKIAGVSGKTPACVATSTRA
jgi:hypothetical protein